MNVPAENSFYYYPKEHQWLFLTKKALAAAIHTRATREVGERLIARSLTGIP